MKPAMGEIMAPPLVKGEDVAPGGHPEAENVPPPGTQTLTNGDDAVATSRLSMSPLKSSAANEGRPAASPHKAPANDGRPSASPHKALANDGRPVASPHKAPAYEGRPTASPHKGLANEGRPAASPYKSPTTSPHKGTTSLPFADCALRRPVLILRRLDPKKMRRRNDILQMGLNEACALRIRKELARGKRNCRRRYLRKMASRKRSTPSSRGPLLKRRRSAEGEAASRKDVVDGTATGREFRSPLKKRNRGLPQVSALPQSLHWSTQNFQPLATSSPKGLRNGVAASSPSLNPQVPSSSLEGHTHPLLSTSEMVLKHLKRENNIDPQLQKKWYDPPAAPSGTIPLIPHHKYSSHPSSHYQVNGIPDSTEQPCSSTLLAVADTRETAQPSRRAIIAGPSTSTLRPPPLIPLPRVDIPGTSHSRNIPHATQPPKWAVNEVPNSGMRTRIPHAAELPCGGPLQAHYVDPRAAAYCPSEDQRRAMLAMRMKTADPPQNPMVLIPASMAQNAHKSMPEIHKGATYPTLPKLVVRKDLTSAVWIANGQQSSRMPVSSVPQPTATVLPHFVSTLPAAVASTSQHTSAGSKLEASQDLSLTTSSVITHPVASSVTSPTMKPAVIGSSPPVSSSQLSLLITAEGPLVPVPPLKATATSAHNTVTTITRAPAMSVMPVAVDQDSSSSSVLREVEDETVISYETKKSKAVKSRKQKYLESAQATNGHVKKRRIIMNEDELPDIWRSVPDGQTTPLRDDEDPLNLSTTTTLPTQESCTSPTKQPQVSVLKENASGNQPEMKLEAKYVAVISVTPTITTTAAAITTTTTGAVTTTTTATTSLTPTTPTSQVSIFGSATSPVLGSSRPKKRLEDDTQSDARIPSPKKSGLPSKANEQESTKTPFIVTPKKRLRVLLESPDLPVKGMPISVVRHLSEATEVLGASEVQARSSIIHTTSEAAKVNKSRSSESRQSLEMLLDKEAPSPLTPPASTSPDSKKAVIWNPHVTDTTTITTPEESANSNGESPLTALPVTPPAGTEISPMTEKEQLKKLVVRVERLTEKSFTDTFLAIHNVSVSCAARLCRHLKVLQGAGQYHRPLNRKIAPARKVLPAHRARRRPPSLEILPPIKRLAAFKFTSAPRASPYSKDYPASSSSSFIRKQSLPKAIPPMTPASISEAAGILNINSLKRRRLIVFRNKRLEPSQSKLLLDIGLSLAKKASRNSTLDGMGARGTLLDPGYFGIKGSARPTQRQASQESQDIPSPNVVHQVQRHHVLHRQIQPTVSLQDGNAYMLQQHQQQQHHHQQQQQQQHQQQQQQHQQQQQQYLGHVPPARMHARTVIPPVAVRAVVGPQPPPRPVLVQAANHNQGARLVFVDQQGQLREALVHRTSHGYAEYPAVAPQRESWPNRPQVSRDPHAPPLMFMGPTGMGAVSRDLVQQPGTQPTVARPPVSRAVPPPLSFMGHTTDTNSWAGSQHGQQPAGPSWPRVVDHSLRNYPVINHTKHVIPDKTAQPIYFVRGPPPPYTPRSSYNLQDSVFQGQPHPSTTIATTSRQSPSNQQVAVVWQDGGSQRKPHPQGHPFRVTTTALCHLPQGTGAAQVSTDQPRMMQQTAAAAAPGVTQRETLVASPQVAADPGSGAASSTATITTTPGTSTGNDGHHCHKTWLPEVMAVVEALLLQLVDAGLPSKETFIIHTVRQLLQARSAGIVSPPFCCPGQEKRWYEEFCSTHNHHLKAQEKAKEGQVRGLSQDEVKEWLARLKLEMIRFHGVPPQRIFYMHELNFFLDQQTREVKYHRMFPGPPMISPGSKDTVSVLFTLGADGQVGPGMIIFPRMVIPERLFESLRRVAGGREWVLGSSINGWLTQDCVLEFVSDVFVPWLRRRAIHFPVALFSSDSISGVSVVPAADRFMAQGVQLIAVPREAAAVLSPAEWILGYHLRWHWGRIVRSWSDTHDNKPLLEENFASFIISFLTARAVPSKVSQKFEKFGLCPFNPQAMFQFLLKYHSMSKGTKSKHPDGN